METFFETLFGLDRDGKLDPNTQRPSFLQMMLLAHEYREDITLPGVAGAATRGLGGVLAPLARARGYRSRYPQYSAPTLRRRGPYAAPRCWGKCFVQGAGLPKSARR
jgi:hypothetical protein